MKNFAQINKVALAITVFALLFAVSASAETMRANIPFGFHTTNAMLPAGEYTLRLEPGSHWLAVSNREGFKCYVPIITSGNKVVPGNGQIIFHQYGESYFLNAVQTNGSEVALTFAASKAEREAAKGVDRQIAVVRGVSAKSAK